MTEVLQVPRRPDGQSFYQHAGQRRSSPSSSSLFLDTAALSSTPNKATATPTPTPHAEHQERIPVSLPPSSASSFSSISNATTLDSTFDSTNSSIDTDLTEDTELDFPNYDDVPYRHDSSITAVPLSSPAFCDDSSEDPTESTCTDTTRSDSPLLTPTVVDDSAIKQEPSRQVDFLSHDWREEDIWASWRHIVSQRKAVYGERSRLENASWRTWAKTKFDLDTVSPERLNWLKESDVTWLYGPLKSAASYPITQSVSNPDSQISKNNSFINKKPILKKRSMSEVMLQKSLSSSSLVKQAASAVQLSGRSGRRYGATSDTVDSMLQSEIPSRDQVDYFASRSTSSGGTPCETQERRHIRFDDRVEQCIAVDCKDSALDEEEESEDEEEEEDEKHNGSTDSSSDDGIVMMKRKRLPGQKRNKAGSRSSSTSGRKIIETLPSTTLKYRTDSPDVTEEAQHHTFGRSWNSVNLSPSPSQETLRPSNPSRNFLLQEDDDDDDDDVNSDSSWSFGATNPRSSFAVVDRRPGGPSSGRGRSGTPGPGPRSGDYEIEGMRRTNSGMFMPIDDEDEDDAVATGLFGRVSETINTAKDIAHVIWNVGWRN